MKGVTLDKGSPVKVSEELTWRGARMCKVHREVSQHLTVALGSCLSTEQICSYRSRATATAVQVTLLSQLPSCTGILVRTGFCFCAENKSKNFIL